MNRITRYRKQKEQSFSAYYKGELQMTEMIRYLQKEVSQIEEDLLQVKNEVSYGILLKELQTKRAMLQNVN